ncbi:MAG: hypothetical protein CVU05_14360 [Bacteroidetes bacterium HGW-Bacteroidetes-21]|jgi:hypothetical protein|nr:MAG: hypothetical protein CVU05_14360 [Bacteroidetes bacterium HGW-Bacteroidetes-21]
MKFIFILIIFIWSVSNLSAQNDLFVLNPMQEIQTFGMESQVANNLDNNSDRNIIFLKLGFLDPWIGLGYERIIIPNLGLETSISLLGASLGPKLYFPAFSSGKIVFHTGVIHAWGFGGLKAYVPMGFDAISSGGFIFSLNLGPQFWYENTNEVLFCMSLRLGKSF